MAILIKGMEMPKSCPCALTGIGYDMYCSFVHGIPARVKEYDECCEKGTRPNWCQLIEVPEPHGRLIDADAIPYKKIMYDDDDFYYGVTKPYIDRIPAVIPASEEVKT